MSVIFKASKFLVFSTGTKNVEKMSWKTKNLKIQKIVALSPLPHSELGAYGAEISVIYHM